MIRHALFASRLVLLAWVFPVRPGVLAGARYHLALRCFQ